MAIKKFKTLSEQISMLKNRKLSINDDYWAEEMLKRENYYNVINGYKDPFIDKRYKRERYKKGTTIEEIYSLYTFDRDIRDVLFKRILMVENTLRSLVSYTFSKYHGHDNYLKFGNFESLKSITTEKQVLENRAKKIHALISNLQRDISGAIEKKNYIKHYVIDYGYVPLWVLVNAISLGELNSFYTLMEKIERVEIAKYWDISEGDLKVYIQNLVFFRNLCAHDERIYNAKTIRKNNKSFYIPDNIYHIKLAIPQDDELYKYGKDDLFSLIIVLKILLPPEEFRIMFNKIEGLTIRLRLNIKSIDPNSILNSMGFFKDWRKIKES